MTKKKWFTDNIISAAKQCKSRSEFTARFPGASDRAHDLKIMDKVCAHMKPKGSRYKRGIYAIIFPDKSVYVGLTHNYEKRISQHITKPTNIEMKNKFAQHGDNYQYIKYGIFLTPKIALIEENKKVEEFKKNGFTILNKMKTGPNGALGNGILKWSKSAIINEAKKHKTKSEFFKSSQRAYVKALRLNLKEAFAHFPVIRRKWTREQCAEEAKKYKTRVEFQKKKPGCFMVAHKKGWIDDYTHLKKLRKENGYWTEVRCIEEAKKYKTRVAYARGSPGAYAYERKIRRRKREMELFLS